MKHTVFTLHTPITRGNLPGRMAAPQQTPRLQLYRSSVPGRLRTKFVPPPAHHLEPQGYLTRCTQSGSGGGRGEAIRNIYYSDRQLPPGHDPSADSGEAPTAGSVAHGH
jgi:hypothetical protein